MKCGCIIHRGGLAIGFSWNSVSVRGRLFVVFTNTFNNDFASGQRVIQ